jgi:hypothetical protein
MNEVREWIFTFGFGHTDENGAPLRNKYVRIIGTHDDARAEMVRRWGRQWAFQYPTLEAAGADRWELTEL